MKSIEEAAQEYINSHPMKDSERDAVLNAFKQGAQWFKDTTQKVLELEEPVKYYREIIVITDPCYLKYSKPVMKRNTIYGDWSCMVYAGDRQTNKDYEQWDEKYLAFWKEYNDPETTDEKKEELRKEFRRFRLIWEDEKILGQFCADGGMVGVFLYHMLDSADIKWIKEHPNCAAVIRDFTGDIKFEVENNELYVVGTGVTPFFTIQSGF